MPDLHKKHRERVKKEFLNSGLEHFPDHRKLELLLFFAIPRADTNALGHRLLDRFGSLSGVFDAPFELLVEVEGIGAQSALLIKTVTAMIRAYLVDAAGSRSTIRNAEEAKAYMMHKFLCEQRECVYMTSLGNNGKILFCDKISQGSPETVALVPSDIIKAALRSNAVRVILAHNHPNGICLPSKRDVQTTELLFAELRRVDVELMDHIIVAGEDTLSMAESGMLPNYLR